MALALLMLLSPWISKRRLGHAIIEKLEDA